MSLAVAYTRTNDGINAPQVSVEVDLSHGLPGFSIVGLPEAAVRECKDRVRSAIINSGFEFPNNRITVNLAPADHPKQGGRFDLPIAVGILAASGQIEQIALESYEFIGELALVVGCARLMRFCQPPLPPITRVERLSCPKAMHKRQGLSRMPLCFRVLI